MLYTSCMCHNRFVCLKFVTITLLDNVLVHSHGYTNIYIHTEEIRVSHQQILIEHMVVFGCVLAQLIFLINYICSYTLHNYITSIDMTSTLRAIQMIWIFQNKIGNLNRVENCVGFRRIKQLSSIDQKNTSNDNNWTKRDREISRGLVFKKSLW